MNIHDLAVTITKDEAGKVKMSVAQVKEVLRILADHIGYDGSVLDGLKNYANRRMAVNAKGKKKGKR